MIIRENLIPITFQLSSQHYRLIKRFDASKVLSNNRKSEVVVVCQLSEITLSDITVVLCQTRLEIP